MRGTENIKDDYVCGNFGSAGTYCYAFYRNPDGTRENSYEYVVVRSVGAFLFSLYQ